MSQLHIRRLRHAGFRRWAIRFGGEHDDFMDLVHDWKAEYPAARWSREALDGHGAWLIDDGLLRAYQDRFVNWQQCLEREQLRQKLEQRRRELAEIEQRRRELGIPRDINEVPF